MSQELDWSKFTRTIRINASVQDVYEALSVPSKLESWFLKYANFYGEDGKIKDKSEALKKGDSFAWKWDTGPHVERGEVTEANGIDTIVFPFANSCEVRFELSPVGDSTRFDVIQSGIPTDEKGQMNIYNGCSTGWAFWMVNLKAWMEHGINLSEKEIELAGGNGYEVVNA